jgi:alpha-galactosidase
MDIMEVGNTGQGTPPGNLTFDEAKTQYVSPSFTPCCPRSLSSLCSFTAWALLKSPLIIGTDLTKATNQTIEILTNKELIAINQDPNVGESVTPFRWGMNVCRLVHSEVQRG